MKHEEFDKHFEPCTVVSAEGARIGLATCKRCGAVVMLDPRDEVNRAREHTRWHNQVDTAIADEALIEEAALRVAGPPESNFREYGIAVGAIREYLKMREGK